MINSVRKIQQALMAILCLFAVVSCQHKDLCVHHPHEVTLKVEFDWRNAPDANPRSMCVYFYPKDGGEYVKFNFIGTQGGYIDLRVGDYYVIAHNSDTEGMLFANPQDYFKHTAYTRECSIFEPILGSAASAPRASGTEDEKVVITPDMMWGCATDDVKVTELGIKYVCVPEEEKDNVFVERDEHIITLYPTEQICLYSYEIMNINNLKHVAQACTSISGMSGALNFCSQELHKESVTLPLESFIDKEAKTITGKFFTFGHSEENNDPHRMVLYIWLDDGQKYYYGGTESEKFNVTDQVHNAPDKRRVHIIIDGLDLPQPIENGHGYKPTIDDWDEIHEEIVMGY